MSHPIVRPDVATMVDMFPQWTREEIQAAIDASKGDFEVLLRRLLGRTATVAALREGDETDDDPPSYSQIVGREHRRD